MDGKRIITVFPAPAPRGQPDDFASRPPIIYVYIACDDNWRVDSAVLPKHTRKVYRAMLDTGASGTSIDDQVADKLGIIPTDERAKLTGFNKVEEAKVANIQIIIPTHNIVLAERATLPKLQSIGQQFHVVLGRTFLRHCRFTVDGPDNSYSLCWVG